MNAITKPPSLFFRFQTYLWRWLLFGAFAGLARPVITPDGQLSMRDDYFWNVKIEQIAFGLLFGLICAVVFTLAQNLFNKRRNRSVSCVVLLATWMGVKLAYFGVYYAMGLNP